MDAVTSSRTRLALVLLVDVVLVIVFAAIGRATHDGDVLGPLGSGLATTAWPFLVALVLGWLIARAWRAPLAPLRTGLIVWAVTVVVGMVLRAVSGQGVAVAFVIVASITLALFLVGWRVVARLASRRRRAV
ncbi:hypothetical protein MTES_0054 [Microbacterium testaceum StLB037]|uniref:DUF3054 domain-containing protein n=1 Tax=Microbacterium testaceum (strain StLB037) TaxID=979556 RepID=E8N7I5_MICTS|nr:DUF3054 domain-containing protein [Microbacterium testaceum]BAJ73018.1 hypothetical protein MTES_0054 [Microbacterium testaceum StLB037]